MNYKLVNNVVGWIVFAIAAFTYMSTAETSASLWDCGEFISAANKLQVVHPPGAPLFLMMGRIFTLFASSPEQVPLLMNYFSALSTAFAILFLFWIITALGRKLILKNGQEPDSGQLIAIMGAGIVGALACTFSDTMWFSAVEGEVYALSTFFIAIVLWGVMKWEANADKPDANRWLVFMAFMIGLSIGVHLLSLLVIPVTVLVYYFKKYKATLFGTGVALVLGFVALGLVQAGVIQVMTARAAANELMMVNNWGLPFNIGILVYYLIVFGFIATVLAISQREKPSQALIGLAVVLFGMFVSPTIVIGAIVGVVLAAALFFIAPNLSGKAGQALDMFDFKQAAGQLGMRSRKNLELFGLAFLFIMLGFSTYVMIPIRSAANTPINMNAPKDAFSLLSYLNREQYGDRPLLYGPLYDASPIDMKETGIKWYPNKEQGKYVEKGKKNEYVYRNEDKVFFPRLYSNGPGHVPMYKAWVGEDFKKPRQSHNFAYFFKYQIGYMWGRYFMWNFAGRQDDFQGTVTNKNYNGNWISGVPFIDNPRLGSQEGLPEVIADHKARNKFYMLPFLLGLLGLVFLFYKNEKWGFVFMFLFIITGVMLIVYFNSPPREPRERDYTLVGSFYTYCVFIGLGVLFLYDVLSKYIPKQVGALAATAVGIIIPVVMYAGGKNDHNRHDRRMARDFAINFLESCPPNAILFTQGDNDTYPLWYVQEVEGIRPDVRVANLSLIGVDWYIDFLQKASNENGPVPFHKGFDSKSYLGDKNNQTFYVQNDQLKGKYYDFDKVLNFVFDESKQVSAGGTKRHNYFPTNTVKLTVDKAAVLKNNVVPAAYQDRIADAITWTLPFKGGGSKYVLKNDLAVMSIIAATDWTRPICFANTVSPSSYAGLDKYLMQEGMMHRLVPVEFPRNRPGTSLMEMNTEASYQRLMDKFQYGGLDEKEHFIDENTHRLMHGLRNLHLSVARNLTAKGEKEKAVDVLERMKEKFPDMNAKYYSPYNANFSNTRYSYNQTTVEWIDLYYKNGRPELAKPITDRMIEELQDAWRFYNLKTRFAANFQGDAKNKLYLHREKAEYDIERLFGIAVQNKDDVMFEQLALAFPRIAVKFSKAREAITPSNIGNE